MQKIAFLLQGGYGYNLAFTAALRRFKVENPDTACCVVTAYPDIYIGNTDAVAITPQAEGSYEFFLKDAVVYHPNPYVSTHYRQHNKHIIKVFGKEIGVEGLPLLEPQFYSLPTEEERIDTYLRQFKKPTVVIQISGGCPPGADEGTQSALKISAKHKSWPVEAANELVALRKELQFIQIRLPHEPEITGAVQFLGSAREAIVLLKKVFTFVVIDSFLQHASAAVEKRGIVLWGNTHPDRLGYPHNINLFCQGSCPFLFCSRPETRLGDTVLIDIPSESGQFSKTAVPWMCPHVLCMSSLSSSLVSENLTQVLTEL